jgi:hypothetical protein
VIVTTKLARSVRSPVGGHPGRFALDPLTGADLVQEFSEPAVQEVVPKGFEWPADAHSPLRNHRAGRYLWLIRPGRLEVLDTESLRIVATVP